MQLFAKGLPSDQTTTESLASESLSGVNWKDGTKRTIIFFASEKGCLELVSRNQGRELGGESSSQAIALV